MKMKTSTNKKFVDLLLCRDLNEKTLSVRQLDGTFSVLNFTCTDIFHYTQ